MAHPILAALIVLSIAILLPACTDRALDPKYPTAVVTFDADLTGEWHAVDDDAVRAEKDAVTITFAADKVPVEDDRLSPDTELGKADETTDAYTISVKTGDPELPNPWNLNAYRLSINGRDYIGAQLSIKQYEQAKLPFFVAPVHYIVRIERDADTLRIWSQEPALAYIPAAKPLDPLPENPAAPPLPADDSDAFAVVTTDIDRLIALLRRPDADTLFASDPVTFKRIAR